MDIPKPSEVKEVENSENASPAEVVVKNDEPPVEAVADQGGDNTPANENNGDASAAAAVEDSETNPAAENDSGTADQESSGAGEDKNSGDQESADEPPEIKVGDLCLVEIFDIKASYSCVYIVCSFFGCSYAARNSTSRFSVPYYKSNQALLYPLY